MNLSVAHISPRRSRDLPLPGYVVDRYAGEAHNQQVMSVYLRPPECLRTKPGFSLGKELFPGGGSPSSCVSAAGGVLLVTLFRCRGPMWPFGVSCVKRAGFSQIP